ncbi:hypothetical protein OPV22_025013 [Ensete ventricosum]|uniref:Uncharacterized protein n=1 Tax=Ensete ventricosum TaxID=4639 RepID=A0AAV8P7X6_ENSVE|nr:hypothetical protein OPV22_025013 [Ensete ventricosum]
MGLLAETTLFVDTNLGTRFALSVPDNITAGDLKQNLDHAICKQVNSSVSTTLVSQPSEKLLSILSW